MTDHPVRSIYARWGWDHPSDRVVKLAANCHLIAGSVEKALVQLELLDQAAASGLSNRKPEGKDILDYATEAYPTKVQPYAEQIQALCQGVAFYDSLEVLEIHEGLKSTPSVIARCEQLDCVLMLIESTRPVVVFATFKGMLNFSMAGRTEKQSDPLLIAAGTETPLMAVGSRDDISAILAQLGKKQDSYAAETVNLWHTSSRETQESPSQREVTRLLDHAIDNQASDIALVPNLDGSYRIFIRRWGALIRPRTAPTWNPQMAAEIIQVLQNKSGANPTNTAYRDPRDGHISYRSAVGEAFMRLSFIPLNHLGEVKTKPSVSIRLFSHSESKIELEKLGLEQEVIDAIDNAVRVPQGLMLVAGPMNSGKSTTIAAALGRHVDVFGESRKRVSVEDPIERFIGGVTQINVPAMMRNAQGEQLADSERWIRILRGLKRHDVNTFWIGEVRDADTAEFCATFASAGQLVLSSIHANNTILAYDVLSKMLRTDLRFQLAESVNVILSQRLIPRLCPHCKQQSKPTAVEKNQWKIYMAMIGEEHSLPATICRAVSHEKSNCEHCENGYSGYSVIGEVLPFTRKVRTAATQLNEIGSQAEARAIMSGARTLTLVGSALRRLKAKDVDLHSIMFL